MGVKYFCDRCEREFKSNRLVVPIYAYDALGIKLAHCGNKILCDECAEIFESVKDYLEHEEDFFDMTDNDIALIEYGFRVGDIVVTDAGEIGFIEDVCDCDKCRERGFCEPKVKTVYGNNAIYITDIDKSNGFASFYQIGKYKFGNLNKEYVVSGIECTSKVIEEAKKRLEKYDEQLERIKTLESFENSIKKDFLVTIDKYGNLWGMEK